MAETTADKIRNALADPDAPWYGSDLVPLVGDYIEQVERATPPPNPHYKRVYSCSLSIGSAELTISAPGNKIAPQDAADILEWLEAVRRQLRRYAGETFPTPPATEGG